jgi:polyhydroxybutyrate depolymerase
VAGLALIAWPAASPAAAATPGCTLEPTSGTVTKSLGGRTYELNVPQGLSGSEVPLLLSLHGFGSNGRQDELFTGWSGYARTHNFIAAYPNGRPGYGGGAWDPYSSSSPDVGFLRNVVDDIAARWCVNPRRIHVDGWSNGAVMSQRVACNAADKFASVTSYGGGTPSLASTLPCQPSRPISVGLFAGQYDFTYAGLAQNTGEWVDYDDCQATPVRTTDAHGTLDTYSCAGGAQVLSRVVSNTSHNWPSGAKGEDQRNRMWAFFQANPLP